MPNPLDDETLYAVFTLGQSASPGYIKSISGHDSKVNWDVKAGTGQSGASVTLKDIPLRTVKIDIVLSDEDDYAAWDDFRDVIESTVAGTTPKALEVYHPELAAVGITSVVKGNISGPKYDGKGGAIYTIELQEYRPPKPKGGSPSGTKKPTNDPNAAANAELAALTAQYAATPWG
jgi:hypothetical protein